MTKTKTEKKIEKKAYQKDIQNYLANKALEAIYTELHKPKSKEELEHLYYNKGLKITTIAKYLNRHRSTIEKRFKKLGIKIRTPSERKMGWRAYWWGKHLSSEIKKKIGKSRKGKYGGENNPAWKGGRFKRSRGYLYIWKPNYPSADKSGYVREHKLIAEKALGRLLRVGKDGDSEVVHHINGDKNDNRNCNLLICTKSYHQWLHAKMSQQYMEVFFGKQKEKKERTTMAISNI